MLCVEVLGGGVYVPRETLLEGVSPCCVPKF